MSNGYRGKLVLQEVPSGEVERKIVLLLSKFARNVSLEALTAKVRNTPYALSNDIPAEKALILLEALQKLGATAAFVPHAPPPPADEQITTVEFEPRFTFDPAPLPEEKPTPVRSQPRENGTRRLVITLITIIFLLSIGYLAYQLWPILGDKIRALGSYLRQLF